MGRIPSFAHGDFSLFESQAIARYIDAVFSVPSIALLEYPFTAESAPPNRCAGPDDRCGNVHA